MYNTNAGLRTTPGGSPAVEAIEIIYFQRVAPETELSNTSRTSPFSAGYPYAPRFILFAALNPPVRGLFSSESFIPQAGIAGVSYEVSTTKPWHAKLVRYNAIGEKETIGTIVLKGPNKKSRGSILPSVATTMLDGNGSFMSVPIKVANKKGRYSVNLNLYGGG